MNNLQYISARYNNDKSITLIASDGSKTHKLKVTGFNPYFYVPLTDPVPPQAQEDFTIQAIELDPNPNGDGTSEFLHEDGFPVKKIITSTPDVVRTLRSNFSNHFEADVPFIRRFLIDTKIHSGITIKSDNINRSITYDELLPSNYETPIVICYIDWEMKTTTRFPNPKNPHQPCTAWTAYNNQTDQYYTAVFSDHNEVEMWSDNHVVMYCQSEEIVLLAFKDYLLENNPHLLVHWNGKIADKEYPYYRARKYGIELPFRNSDDFDCMLGYQHLHHKLYNRLKDVAVEEGIYTPEELVADQYRQDLMEKDLKAFIKYNWMDVNIMVILNEKGWFKEDINTGEKKWEPPRHIGQFFWELKSFIGLESIKASIHNSVLIDTMGLRQANGRFILNSGQEREEERASRGGLVFDPMEGIFENLAVLDMSRYYPSIFLAYNVDPLINEVVRKLLDKREQYEKEMKNCRLDTPDYTAWEKKRNVVKFLLNSTYSYFGAPWTRKYKKEKFEIVTGKARLGLEVIKKAAELKGTKVIYGDTDSLMIQYKTQHDVDELVWHLNEVALKEHCLKEGVPNLLKIKHEKSARAGLFAKSKTGNGAAKKRYALNLIWENGKECDYIDITGFDYVRGNCSKVTRRMQMKIITDILRGNKKQIPSYLFNLTKDIKADKFPISDIAIPYTLSKAPDFYGLIDTVTGHHSATPEYVKGARWAIQNLNLEITAGDRVKMIYCLRPTPVISYFDEESLPKNIILDHNKTIEKIVKMKAEQFLRLANISWSEVQGTKPISRWF